MIKFTEIPDKLKYPTKLKAQLSTIHSDIVTYVASNFQKTTEYRNKVLGVMNTLSYLIIRGDSLPHNWISSDPLNNISTIDDYTLKDSLGDLYLYDRYIIWDVEPTASSTTSIRAKPLVKPAVTTVSDTLTPKESLYINSPQVPRFDTEKPWMQGDLNGEQFIIYESLPAIPRCQNEISITTDINKMTSANLMKLYPNHTIQTRSDIMYSPVPGLEFDEVLGVIFPISQFTAAQVKDNIIKYPHLFRLKKQIGDSIVSFYKSIEIDGILYDTMQVWDTLPESKSIPRSAEFIKEYVVRRYLLERDILHISHKYDMYGTLDPFLTLFATSDTYIQLGYPNTEDIARKCVESRISYKQSRNPILRRWHNE